MQAAVAENEIELSVCEWERLHVCLAELDLRQFEATRGLLCPAQHEWREVGGDVAELAVIWKPAKGDTATARQVENRTACGHVLKAADAPK